MATVIAGISKAVATGKIQVYVSEGLYNGRVTLANGVSLYVGYSQANNWARSGSYVSIVRSGTVGSGRVSAMEGNAISSPTTIDRLTIQTQSTAVAGTSNYALYCNGCTALTIKNSTLEAGDGGAGMGGTNGASGNPGGNGSAGGLGNCDNNVSGGAGGPGGTSSCGRTGGSGG